MGVKLLALLTSFSFFGKKPIPLYQKSSFLYKTNVLSTTFKDFAYNSFSRWSHYLFGSALIKRDDTIESRSCKKNTVRQDDLLLIYEEKKLCEAIEKIFDKNDTTKITELLSQVKEFKYIYQKHPELKKLIEDQYSNPNMWNFYSEILNLSNDQLPENIAQKKKELEEKTSWQDVWYLYQKFKK